MTLNIKKAFFSCLLLFLPGLATVRAREDGPVKLSDIERIKTESIWFTHGDNPVGILLDSPDRYTVVGATYSIQDGDFKRVQSGKRNTIFDFYTEGGGIYENIGGMYMWGSFDYKRGTLRDTRWNASLVDPLRDMPYILADSNLSKWINQEYALSMKAASPVLWDRLIFGLEGTYEAGLGAKQRDPRPKTNMYLIEVIPSIALLMGDKHTLGATFRYSNRREEGNASSKNNNVSQAGWDMYYPGYFRYQYPVNAGVGNLRWNANCMGGSLQYFYSAERLRLLLQGSYLNRVEDAISKATTIPGLMGTVRTETWTAKAALNYRFNRRATLLFDARYSDKAMDGIEYVNKEVRSEDGMNNESVIYGRYVASKYFVKSASVHLGYMNVNSAGEMLCKVGVTGAWNKSSDRYLIPASSRRYDNIDLGLYVMPNFLLGNDHSILLTVKENININTKGENRYGGYFPDDPAYTEFGLIDYYYLTTSYVNTAVSLIYNYSGIANRSIALYAGVDGNYIQAVGNGGLFSDRWYLNFKVGITF